MLIGRGPEQEQLRALFDDARAGRSRVLAVRGPAGTGKPALLESAVETAGLRTVRAVGLEGEAQFPYAALDELLTPLLELRDELPAAQAKALGAAPALEEGMAAPFAVAAATLSAPGRP